MRRRFVFLALPLAALALALTGCGGGEETAPAPETVEGTVATEDSGSDTTTGAEDGTETEGETETGDATETEGEDGGEDGGAAAAGNAEAGKAVWDANGCGGCHTLAAAGSSGNIGPNLDESKPEPELVVERVRNGMGAMPAFEDQLSDEQIADVTAYVVQSTSG